VRPALRDAHGRWTAIADRLCEHSEPVIDTLIARRREMSPARGSRCVRLAAPAAVLVENAILCIMGGAAGVLLRSSCPGSHAFESNRVAPLCVIEPRRVRLLFGRSASVACALMFSLVPALESRRARLNDSLALESHAGGWRTQSGAESLVVGEVATSLVLLVARHYC